MGVFEYSERFFAVGDGDHFKEHVLKHRLHLFAKDDRIVYDEDFMVLVFLEPLNGLDNIVDVVDTAFVDVIDDVFFKHLFAELFVDIAAEYDDMVLCCKHVIDDLAVGCIGEIDIKQGDEIGVFF